MTKSSAATFSEAEGMLLAEMSIKARKEPRQARSIAMVEAVKQTARRLLEQHGRKSLTTVRLAEESGVASSSIYEYFPTMDALVAAIYDDYRNEVHNELLARIASLPPQATLFDGICLVLETGLRLHHQKVRIDPVLSVRATHYDELMRLNRLKAGQALSESATQALMCRFANEVRVENWEKARFLAFHTMLGVSRAILLERSDYLTEKGTVTMMARMVHAVLTTPQA